MILGKVSIAPDEIKCYNPGFDVTPPNLIEAIITEKGTFKGLEKQICEWYEITPELIQRYLIDNNLVDEVISVSDIADGNLNNCFKIEGISNNKRVVYCLKQALPYIKCLGKENPLDLKRSFFECEAMKYYNEVAPSNTTKFYFYDPKLFIIVMEFLENNTILRKKMIQRVIYPNIGTKLGNFIANTTFFSSHIHISPKEFRNKINCFNENTLTELTEKVIFSDPYVNDSWNRHTPGLENIINEIRTNKNLIKNIFKLRQYFITEKQALIHADLHIGSIMVHDDDLNCDPKVIDGEFIIVGPIAFDLGKLVGNFVMNYYSQILHPNEKTNEKDYCEYLLNEIRNIFVSFKQEFLKLWSIKENRYNDFPGLFEGNNELFYEVQNDYISSILKNSYYFMAASIIRRIIGVAHNIDFEMENDVSKRVKAETRALKFAYSILSDSVSIVEIDDLIKFIAIN